MGDGPIIVREGEGEPTDVVDVAGTVVWRVDRYGEEIRGQTRVREQEVVDDDLQRSNGIDAAETDDSVRLSRERPREREIEAEPTSNDTLSESSDNMVSPFLLESSLRNAKEELDSETKSINGMLSFEVDQGRETDISQHCGKKLRP